MRYFLELSYKGKDFYGWQIQPEQKSVQGEIEQAISTLLRIQTKITGAGRTDAGVHALQMFAHFEATNTLHHNFKEQLNALLPNTIVISDLFLVDATTHARFDALSRSYEYRIWLGRNPFLLDTTWQIHHQKLDIATMNEAAKILLEYRNFQCFSKVKTQVKTFDCNITHAEWIQEKSALTFYITANRFLRNMVRAIVGTLVAVGLHKISVADFTTIIQSRDRTKAGISAPAEGLFLTQVQYIFSKQPI